MPTTTGLATSFITFSRPGASGGGATVTDRDGRIKWAGHNLLTNSESFDASAWAKGGSATATANTQASPNGTTTADTIVIVGNANNNIAQSVAVLAGATYTASVYLRVASGTLSMKLHILDGGGWGSATTQTVIITDQWQMFTVSKTIATAGTGYFIIGNDNATGGIAGTFIAWGAHLYRSDLGGMQANPAMPAGMQTYYPTTPRNLLGATENFTSSPSPWNNVRAAVTADAAVAPNGLQTADAINQTAGSTAWALLQQTSAVAAGRKVFSVYAKPNGKNYLIMQANLNGAGNALTWFNVSTGAAGTTNASHTALTPVSVGNGWYRFAIALDSTAATWSFGVGLADADNSTTVTDVGGLYLWGAQLSDSASLDTYVPVYGSTVTSAAYYAPRLDFDGATLAAKGLLVEELRTNTIVNSSVFSGWNKATATVLDNQVSGPDGSVTAGVITATAANGEIYTQVTSTSGVAHTGSIYVKRKTGTGSVYLIDAAAGRILVTASITTENWTRISVTANSVSVNPFFGIRLATSGDELYIWGAQLEAGSFATSYIPTGASTATRAADVASVSTQAFPYSASEGTLVANVTAFSPSTYAVTSFGAVLFDGVQTYANAIRIEKDGSLWRGIKTQGGSAQIASVSYTQNTATKIGVAYANSNNAASFNGASATSLSGDVPSAANMIGLGGNGINGNIQLNGHIRQITYLPRRISNAELQSRTA